MIAGIRLYNAVRPNKRADRQPPSNPLFGYLIFYPPRPYWRPVLEFGAILLFWIFALPFILLELAPEVGVVMFGFVGIITLLFALGMPIVTALSAVHASTAISSRFGDYDLLRLTPLSSRGIIHAVLQTTFYRMRYGLVIAVCGLASFTLSTPYIMALPDSQYAYGSFSSTTYMGYLLTIAMFTVSVGCLNILAAQIGFNAAFMLRKRLWAYPAALTCIFLIVAIFWRIIVPNLPTVIPLKHIVAPLEYVLMLPGLTALMMLGLYKAGYAILNRRF